MSTYNNQTTHELVDLISLFQVKESQLLVSRIISIDTSTKTASIQFVETCPALENVSAINVPFFYHCEYSSGTLEDLEYGYRAFRELDYVYVLYIPASETLAEQMYIIGHFDIRNTRLCLHEEYLFITFNYYYGGINYSYLTIFDTLNARELDLSTFVSLPGSPAAPTSFPVSSSEAAAWVAYNFESFTPVVSVTGTIESRSFNDTYDTNDSSGLYEETIITDNSTLYTGDSWAACEDWDAGNGGSSLLSERVVSRIMSPESMYNVTTSEVKSSITKYNWSPPTMCTSYWKNITRNTRESGEGYAVQNDATVRSLIRIVSEGTWDVYLKFSFTRNDSFTFTASGDNDSISSATFSYAHNWNRKLSVDWTNFNRPNVEHELEWYGRGYGNLSLPPVFGEVAERDLIYSSITTSHDGEEIFPSFRLRGVVFEHEADLYPLFTPWSTSMSSTSTCFKVGTYWIYGLIGFLTLDTYQDNTQPLVGFYDYNVATWDHKTWPEAIGAGVYEAPISGPRIERLIFSPHCDTVVTSIHNDLDPAAPSYAVSLKDCITKSDMYRSKKLNETISKFYPLIVSQHINYSDPEQAFTDALLLHSAIMGGPVAEVKRKKQI